ncbi:transposase family protein [Dactylosporangium cerinum]|uniref:Transposase family protein n=1 Tax=Dactylosporangium cerinum TaxID=1434730 RepID=A0ABV9WDD8_9ACTN
MLSYPSAISLSTRSLNHLTTLLRGHRRTLGSRWRRLDPGRQALLALAHLRNGDTYAQLAVGFGIGVTTAWRYIREAVDLLAATAPTLTEAMRRIRRLAFGILDGTLISIDRIRGHKDRLHYSGKHKRHGVNVQVIADPHGRPVWLSPALPGATHDLTAARAHGIIAALTGAAVATLADKAYRGAGGAIGVPHYGRDLPPRMRDCNSSHNQIRGIGERANATLKTWRLLRRLRCCPQQATALTAAILVLQQVEEQHG